MTLRPEIEKALQALETGVTNGELAYLALTAKVEQNIRDRLAYQLHVDLGRGRLVAREWRRRDLAILSGVRLDPPLAIVELKQMYSFDTFEQQTDESEYPSQLLADLAKARLENVREVYLLLLSTHADLRRAQELEDVVKYIRHMGRAVKEAELGEVRRVGALNLEAWMRESAAVVGEFTKGVIEAGSAFEIPVEIDYWLVGPAPAVV